jgi:diamine N-acetyltransferase
VTLEPITRHNWREATALELHAHQTPYVADQVAPATLALAKAYVRPAGLPVLPYGVCDGPLMVGFLMLAYEPGTPDNYWLSHFYVDRRYQGRGYGAAALEALVALLRQEHPGCRALHLTVHGDNVPARKLYERAGFVDTRARSYGEHVYRLALPPPGR